MSLPRYPEYRDSGVDWLGDVPAHWEVQRIKRGYAVVGGSTPKSDVAAYWDGDIDWVTPADLSKLSGFEISGSLRKITVAGLDSCGTSIVPPGSLILSTRAPIGSLGLATSPVCTNQGCKALIPKPGQQSRFAAYALSIAGPALNVRGKGTTFLELSGDELANFPLALPETSEQLAITSFLDRETARIDALIAEQEKLLALLAEKRQSTISHAVTRGLDPRVPMKDSCISWLGEVPAHWEIVPFRYCVDFQEGPGIMAVDFFEEGVPLLRVGSVQGNWATLDGCNYLDPKRVEERWQHFRVEEGDLLISASASMGTVAEVGPEVAGSIPYTGIIRLKGIPGTMEKTYIRHLVVSGQFLTQIDLLKAGATIQHFGPTHLSQMIVAKPPVEEQTRIAAHLDASLSKFLRLEGKASEAIGLLKERRSALISAAVTGQIDVRTLV